MADGGTSWRAGGSRGNSLGFRLALGFISVALAAVALLAGLTVVFASADVSALVDRQRTELTGAVAAAAGAGWELHDSWLNADLFPALDLASHAGAEAQIKDSAGTVVASSPTFAQQSTLPQFRAVVMVRGRPVGEALVRFTGSGLSSADGALRSALLRAIAAAAGLAALLALLTGLGMARRLSRPVAHIISVTRAMGRGVRTARVGEVRAPDELAELGTALDQMADRLDRQEQLRRDLVADLAHELRTPIAVLQAGHESLIDGFAEPTPEQLVSLHDEVLRLARMVDDLQALAAADAAALHLRLRPGDLAHVAASASDSLASRFGAAGLTLDRSLERAEILADPRWLHQVVTNLLTNALKFSPAGSSVRIDVRRAGPEAVLQVTDSGVGIPAGELPHIFDRFWRGRDAAHISGSGIGLAVAAELVTAHGGQLTASSEPGRGTQMTVTLPARSADLAQFPDSEPR
jgi:two-component system, OmpR family, sensor histidine kinase BaeS